MRRIPNRPLYHQPMMRLASAYTCEGCGHKMMGGRYGLKEKDSNIIHLLCPSCWDLAKEKGYIV